MAPRSLLRRRWLAAASLAVAVPLLASCDPLPPATPDVNPGDGVSAETAGASCWGIKQAHPTSADGVYWVYNAVQDRPREVYCDMTTDGGGWVLVGRGREGWSFLNRGQGSEAAVRTVVDGPDAFQPAALPAAVVDELVGGTPMTDLEDGVRLERATNIAGTARQDYRLFPDYDEWSWSMPAGKRLQAISVDGVTYANGNTRDTSVRYYDYPISPLEGVRGASGLFTPAIELNDWQGGFGFIGVAASSDPTSYVWHVQGNGVPFTRVWLRPRIANGDVSRPQIPKLGYPADPNQPNLQDQPERAPWGVVGINHDGEPTIEPWNTTVSVIKTSGDRVFVGGRFTHVRQGPSGAQYAQQSLAAFDLDGNWIETFRPQVDGRVWDMTLTDDGKLIIGGDFTSVDGQPFTAGMAALDPATGQVISSWRGSISHTTAYPIVRALDFHDGWVYAAGRFNRVVGGTWGEQIVSSAVSLRGSDGQPGTWKPRLSGTAVRVRASAAGDRVYIAGYFNAVNNDTNHGYHGITHAADGTPVADVGPFLPSEATRPKYQQAVAEVDDKALVGGSEHNFQIYDRQRTGLVDAFIARQPGDFQTIEIYGDDIYAGCHCSDRVFMGTNQHPNPFGSRDVERINHIARWDSETLEYDPTWVPDGLRGTNGEGVWTSAMDARGCLWVGGDLTRGSWSGSLVDDWLGGFGRFCPTDSTPPTQPMKLEATASGDGVDLTWRSSTDDRGGAVRYDVFRNGRVIATVSGTSFHDDLDPGQVAHYAVRAVDAAGNNSASTAPRAGERPAEDPPAEDPAVQEQPAQDPPADDPAAQDQPADDPAAQDPPTDDPTAQDQPADDPAAQDPPTDDPTASGAASAGDPGATGDGSGGGAEGAAPAGPAG